MLIGCQCGGTYRVSKIGMTLQTTAYLGPYKLYMVDEHECDECGAKVYPVPPSQKVLAEHFMNDFEDLRTAARNDGGLIELEVR